MKKILVFTLSLCLSIVLGAIAEFCSGNLFLYAEEMTPGKPMPGISQWVFDVFGNFENGGLICIFLIPWALFLFHWLLGSKVLDPGPDVRLIYGFICYSLCEALLFIFFTFAAILPVIPYFIRNPPKSLASAFIPHGLLAVILAVVVVVAVRNIVFRLREKKGGRKAEALKGES
jgi:hypothetical protein